MFNETKRNIRQNAEIGIKKNLSESGLNGAKNPLVHDQDSKLHYLQEWWSIAEPELKPCHV